MKKKFIGKNAFQRAYSAWFADYEAERKRQKKRRGAKLDNWPAPPTHPDEIKRAADSIGQERCCVILGVHRDTLKRWCTGESAISRAAWLLMVLLDQGRLPGMSDDWRQWRIQDDRLALVGTRHAYTPRELAGIPYLHQHIKALTHENAALKKQIAHLLQVGNFESANDPIRYLNVR